MNKENKLPEIGKEYREKATLRKYKLFPSDKNQEPTDKVQEALEEFKNRMHTQITATIFDVMGAEDGTVNIGREYAKILTEYFNERLDGFINALEDQQLATKAQEEKYDYYVEPSKKESKSIWKPISELPEDFDEVLYGSRFSPELINIIEVLVNQQQETVDKLERLEEIVSKLEGKDE